MKLKVNYKKILILCLSSTLSFSSLGCGVKQDSLNSTSGQEVDYEEPKVEEKMIQAEMKKEEKTNEKIEETKEEDVIAYFETLENDIYDEITKDDHKVLERIQEKCAHFILFMANEEEIKGYTWSELTEETKAKIVTIFLRVDEKVTNKYPDYVDKIKTYSKKASAFISDTYISMKEKANTYIDEKIDEETQEEIKESFQEGYEDLKESISTTTEKIKQWAKNKKS